MARIGTRRNVDPEPSPSQELVVDDRSAEQVLAGGFGAQLVKDGAEEISATLSGGAMRMVLHPIQTATSLATGAVKVVAGRTIQTLVVVGGVVCDTRSRCP